MNIGTRIESEFPGSKGTLGCVAMNSNQIFLVSCYHVLNPQNININHFTVYDNQPNKIALYQNIHLFKETDSGVFIADIAVARLDNPFLFENTLPAFIPGTNINRITGVTNVHSGVEVFMWGAISKKYLRGTIKDVNSKNTWDYFDNIATIEFNLELEFSIDVDYENMPKGGDSGGAILNKQGELLGFILATPTQCSVRNPGMCVAYGTPAKKAFQKLGLTIKPVLIF